ncbi:APC family permease [Streptomyces sp. NPDC004838]
MTETDSGQAPPSARTDGLRPNSVGTFGMALMVIAAMAPLTALASNLALSMAFGNGIGTVGVVLVVAGILVLFTAGYVLMTQRTVNAGAYYAFIGFGLGRTAGSASAMIATLAYNAAGAAMAAAVGFYADLTVTTYLGPDLPWYLYALAAILLSGMLGYFGLSFAARATSVVCIAQFVILLVLVSVVLVRNPGGFSLDVFAPKEVFSGNLGFAVVFILLSFAGYEATAIYGEEARERKSIARATYLALGLLAVVFVLSSWALVAAVDDIVALARQDPGAVVSEIAGEYLGSWSSPLLLTLIAFSFLAACVAFHNMAARYMFSLGRSGLLPSRLADCHAVHGTPHIAGMVQCLISLAVVTPFAVIGADPLINLFPAVSGITSLSVVYLMSAVCLSVVTAAVRGKLTGGRWATRIAPALAGLALLGCGYVIVSNYGELTGSDAVAVNFMPLLLVVCAVYGAVAYRRKGGGQIVQDPETPERSDGP